MSLTLITGPANAGKAGRVLGAYRRALAGDPLLVVPTAADAEHYRRELAGAGAVLGGRICTFADLVRELARRAGCDEQPIGAVTRERLVAAAVADCRLVRLAESARAPGFAAAAGRLIAELDQSLLDPSVLPGALERWGRRARRREYARELAAIYEAYGARLRALGRIDAERLTLRALGELRTEPRRWGRTPVFFYGFDDLTRLQLDAVETLARVVDADVTLGLTFEPGRVTFAACASLAAELRDLADEVVELPARDDHYAPAARATLARLERRLFEGWGDRAARSAGQPGASATDAGAAQGGGGAAGAAAGAAGGESGAAGGESGAAGGESGAAGGESGAAGGESGAAGGESGAAVCLLEAGGERAEAELVADEVRALLDGGVPAGEIAVVARSGATVLERVFTALGLPFNRFSKRPLGHTALGRGVLALARCALAPASGAGEQQAPAGELVRYLRMPGAARDDDAVDALERRARHDRIGAESALRERWRGDRAPWLALDGLRAAAREGAAPFARMLGELAGAAFGASLRGAGAPLNGEQALDAEALRTLRAALDEFAGLAEQRGAPVIDPAAIVDAVAALEVGVRTAELGGAVAIADPLAIRARRFRAVIVCGLQEGELPRRVAPDPFLGDEERRQLADDVRLAPVEDPLARERLLFYSCVSRPTDRLLLSYRSADEDGRPEQPSFFLDDVREALGERLPKRSRTLAEVAWTEAQVAVEPQADAAARSAVEEPIASLEPAAAALLHHRELVSAGAIESYAACPVKWLVERELNPTELAPDGDPLAKGSVAHSVLEQVFGGLGEGGEPAALTPERLPRARELLAAALVTERGRRTLGEGPRAEIALRDVELHVTRYLEWAAAQGPPWPATLLEQRFGLGEDGEPSLDALVIGEQGATVRVNGIIDRVEIEPGGGAFVRDYKSGAKSSDWAHQRWEQGGVFQVPLYMLAVRRLLGHALAGGAYQPLRGDLRARGLIPADGAGGWFVDADRAGGEELERVLERTEQRAVELVRALRAGELEPCPQTCSSRGCRYPGICRAA